MNPKADRDFRDMLIAAFPKLDDSAPSRAKWPANAQKFWPGYETFIKGQFPESLLSASTVEVIMDDPERKGTPTVDFVRRVLRHLNVRGSAVIESPEPTAGRLKANERVKSEGLLTKVLTKKITADECDKRIREIFSEEEA